MYIKFIIRTGLLIFTLLSFAVLCACSKPDTIKKSELVISTKPHALGSDVNAEEVTRKGDSVFSVSDTYVILNNENTVIKGNGAAFENSVLTISEGGTYHLSGELSDGQICVDSADEKPVRLYFDGVSVSSYESPALKIRESTATALVFLCDDTVNSFSDTTDKKESPDNEGVAAVIHSEAALKFDGDGILDIRTGSGKGILVKKNIDIADGYIHIDANQDMAVDCAGDINMTDGTFVVSGQQGEEKYVLGCGGQFNVSEGTFLALGNVRSQHRIAGTDDVRVLTYRYSEPGEGLNVITEEDGEVIVGFEAPQGLKSMTLACEQFDEDEIYTLWQGGSISGEEFNKVYSEGYYKGGTQVGELS